MQRAPFLLLASLVAACATRPTSTARPTRPEPRAAPSAPSVSSSTSLADALAEDMAPEHGMPWSATRRLVWPDFKGKPPRDGDEGARTAYGIFYVWTCHGDTFAFRVTAAFLPYRSWVKADVLRSGGESARVLRHEQTHFDISELYARHMRKRFAQLSAPCKLKDAELAAQARELVEEENATQRRYDEETNHSLEIERQLAWEDNVAKTLVSLRRYAQ